MAAGMLPSRMPFSYTSMYSHSGEGKQAASDHQRRKDPVQQAAALMKLSFRVMVAVFMR
jgi:hypothetical protein